VNVQSIVKSYYAYMVCEELSAIIEF